MSRVVALVAAHDEEEAVGSTVGRLRSLPGVDDVVVVADGCSDGTVGKAAAAGARVLVTPRRLGKGGALEGALGRLPGADLYLLVDADTGDTAGEADQLLDHVRSGRLDLAIGALPAQEGGGFGVVKRLAVALIRHVAGFDALAPLSGQRALSAEAMAACRPLARGFGVETAMTVDAARLGLRIGEVPVAMRHRATGRTLRGFAHRGRQGLDLLWAILPRAFGIR